MPRHEWRLRALQGLTIALFILFVARALTMQVLHGARYRAEAATRILRERPVEAARGLVLDRNGRVLAENAATFGLAITPGVLPRDPTSRASTLAAVAAATGVSADAIEMTLRTGIGAIDPFAAVPIIEGLTVEQAIAYRARFADTPAVSVQSRAVRRYQQSDALPQVLGNVGAIPQGETETYLQRGYALDARIGLSGIERVYEAALRGRVGRDLVATNRVGQELQRYTVAQPTPGADIRLSIDVALQRAALTALADGISAGLPKSTRRGTLPEPTRVGAAVVIDVHTGELLALASLPTYDANLLADGADAGAVQQLLNDPARPLVHRAWMEPQAPGSIFKPIVAAAALQEAVVTPSTRITSTGAITIADQYRPGVQYVFRDWAALGSLDLYGAIAKSSDVYFYYLSGGYQRDGRVEFDGLGNERLATYARRFGLGRPTGLDLPGEGAGLVPDESWKTRTVGDPWVLGDTYTFGIGQGYLTATPLQMAVAAAAIANGGTLVVPHVVSSLRRDTAFTPVSTTTAGRVPVAPDYLAVVREGMRRAAEADGTAANARIGGIAIGGKTGTAEFGPAHPDGQFDTHGWFLGFAPFEQPEIAVVVYLEHGIGSEHAAPVARRIMEAYFADRLPPRGTVQAQRTP